jgi:hypothetical protein
MDAGLRGATPQRRIWPLAPEGGWGSASVGSGTLVSLVETFAVTRFARFSAQCAFWLHPSLAAMHMLGYRERRYRTTAPHSVS